VATRPDSGPSAVDALTGALRHRILNADLPPGRRLVEREIVERHGAARVTVRAALRALEAEGLVRVEPNRGARVAELDAEGLRGLFELRTALEVEATRMALERDGGRVAPAVREAVARLGAAARAPSPEWAQVADAHEEVHAALVAASGSERLLAAHRALAGELRLFMAALREQWSPERTARHHEALVEALEDEGVEALRRHLRDGEEAVRRGLPPSEQAK
jgi:DNA-binding GntR family transcriptional regulator